MSKRTKRAQFAPPLALPDFASMADRQILAYAKANPYQGRGRNKLMTDAELQAMAQRCGEALYKTLTPEQQKQMIFEMHLGLESEQAIRHRYFPGWPQFK